MRTPVVPSAAVPPLELDGGADGSGPRPRERGPRWGKDTLAVVLGRNGIALFVRPHQALGYSTPTEYLTTLGTLPVERTFRTSSVCIRPVRQDMPPSASTVVPGIYRAPGETRKATTSKRQQQTRSIARAGA